MTARLVLTLLAAVSALAAAGSVLAAVNPLVSFREMSLPGGLVSTATCIQGADPADGGPNGGVLVLASLPIDAVVLEAQLYWTVLSPLSPVRTGSPEMNGTPLAVEPLAELPLSPCFPPRSTASFRADVSAQVQGNGSFALTGFPGVPAPGPSDDITEGASLFVLYCAPGEPDRSIVWLDGLDVIESASTVFNQEIAGFLAAAAGPVNAVLHAAAGNGQSRGPGMDGPDPFRFNGEDMDLIYPEILSGGLCFPTGLYDHTRVDVTGLVEPFDTGADLEIEAMGDCYTIAALALVVETVPGEATPEPSALDRDPAATPLTVTRSPSGLELRWEDLGPGTVYHAYRGTIGTWYDHGDTGACDLVTPDALLGDEPGNHYFLAVTEGCGGAESTPGRDSLGAGRPSAAACP